MLYSKVYKELSKHKETEHLVTWFGDYALYERALNVTKEEIMRVYEKLCKDNKETLKLTVKNQEGQLVKYEWNSLTDFKQMMNESVPMMEDLVISFTYGKGIDWNYKEEVITVEEVYKFLCCK